jgi:LCP family protein required for cell wall assembly
MMLSDLDTDSAFSPDAAFRERVLERGRRLRRRRRIIRAASVVVAAALIVAAAATVGRQATAGRTNRVTAAAGGETPTNVLLIGPAEQRGHADALAVLRFDGGTLRILPIPRDLWDPIRSDRIRGTYEEGAAQTAEAVTRLTGIPVDHTMEVDFGGFRAAVDAASGVRVEVSTPVRDVTTGFHLGRGSCATLSGDTTLAAFRSRHLEYQDGDGRWRIDGTGDLGRILRANVLLRSLLSGSDPGHGSLATSPFAVALGERATLDDGLSEAEFRDLLRRGAVTADSFVNLPVGVFTAPNGAIGLQLAAGADDVVRKFGATSVPTSQADPIDAGPAVRFAGC